MCVHFHLRNSKWKNHITIIHFALRSLWEKKYGGEKKCLCVPTGACGNKMDERVSDALVTFLFSPATQNVHTQTQRRHRILTLHIAIVTANFYVRKNYSTINRQTNEQSGWFPLRDHPDDSWRKKPWRQLRPWLPWCTHSTCSFRVRAERETLRSSE